MIILILTLGIICESKAQFPASPDIYCYIQTDGSDYGLYFVQFYPNGQLMVKNSMYITIDKYIPGIPGTGSGKKWVREISDIDEDIEELKQRDATLMLFDKNNSTENTYSYRYHNNGNYYQSYYFFSSNKEDLRHYETDFRGEETNTFYKRIAIDDLKKWLTTIDVNNLPTQIPLPIPPAGSNNTVIINNTYNNGGSSSTGGNNKQVKEHTYYEVCSSCHGTGYSQGYTSTPYYGGVRVKEYCPVCKRRVYPHTHKACSRCHGTGQVKRTSYSYE